MKFGDFNSMSLDQVWTFHEQVCAEITRKLTLQRSRIEQRLSQLDQYDMVAHS
jgi:hypothetical protein